VLRGKPTDKVAQHGHDTLSTFGIGADVGEPHWRSVLRQLIALGYLRTEGEYNTLSLTRVRATCCAAACSCCCGTPTETSRTQPGAQGARPQGAAKAAPIALDDARRLASTPLKAWRGAIAREHNLPAYVVFHDATSPRWRGLSAIARRARRHQRRRHEEARAYGADILRVVAADL
jgi:ATP-dependent DNA helicase RecQ